MFLNLCIIIGYRIIHVSIICLTKNKVYQNNIQVLPELKQGTSRNHKARSTTPAMNYTVRIEMPDIWKISYASAPLSGHLYSTVSREISRIVNTDAPRKTTKQ